MAYVGGKWTLPEGILPGARINVISKDRASAKTSERGVVAVPMALDWGAEDIATFVPSDYTRDALQKFGYEIGSEKIRDIGELFCGATKIVVARLNGKGEKASSEVGVAKYPGTRGNDIAVTIEGDPDMGTEENPVHGIKVTADATENVIEVNYSKIPEGFTPDVTLMKDGNPVTVESTLSEKQVTLNVPATVEEGSYSLVTSLKKNIVNYTINTFDLDITVNPEEVSTIKLTKGTEKTGTAVETATATYSFNENTITVEFANVPEGYKPSVRIKGQVGGILAFTPGRLEDKSLLDGKKHIITYSRGAAINGTMTIEACLTKDKITVLNSCTYTCAKEGEDKPAQAIVSVGEDSPVEFPEIIPSRFIVTTYLEGTEVDVQKNKTLENIKDNNFVIWDRTKPLEEAGGILFSGGTNSEVTSQSYSDALNVLESQVFHILACPSDEEAIKQMYIKFTEDNRESGNYFQVVTPKTEATANSEAVIQVENRVLNSENPESALVYWVAGQQAGCSISESVANIEYDGVYEIDLKKTQRQLENNVLDGYFCFHQARGIDREQYCKTLLDINTLTDYEDGKDKSWSNNTTIRVADEACNYIAALFNNNYFGRVKNNEAGREQFQNDLIQYFQSLETQGAIDAFDTESIEVVPAEDPRAIIVVAAWTPMNSLEQMYMTLIIE